MGVYLGLGNEPIVVVRSGSGIVIPSSL